VMTMFARLNRGSLAPILSVLVGSLLVWLLPSSGPAIVFKAVVFCLLIVPMPALIVARTSDRNSDWIVVISAATVCFIALYALVGFLLTNWLSIRWTTGVILIVTVVGTIIATFATGSAVSVRERGALGLAAALALSAAIVAVSVHLALPPVPVESAFSVSPSAAVVTSTGVSVKVTINSVGPAHPQWLMLMDDETELSRVDLPHLERSVTLRGTWPRGERSPCATQIEISASNGTYLTPVVDCDVRR
jgi:hypothetical protein